MKSSEIRDAFIRFFLERGHTFVKSAPLHPRDDPSLLFTNAGMNQFKNIFLGAADDRSLKRAVNSQKCMRVSGKHNDLEEVGRDGSHHTFFEMLGNWSFGDYGKKEAVDWAWTLLTKVFSLPKDRLYATVYKDDAEAALLWQQVTDIRPDRILPFDEKFNFWEMGDAGPCGPCSEIHFDLGPDRACGPSCAVNCACGRFMEIWNLVFIQYDRQTDGSLKELKAKHVDTGMGLERIVSVIQGKKSNYGTDLFMPLIRRAEALSGKKYEEGPSGMPFRVIADHLRAVTFAIADDILPGNDGRGYVVRRLLRRAYRFGRKLGLREPFLNRIVPDLVTLMGSAFPEIAERSAFVEKIIEAEERAFEKTLDRGLSLFEEARSRIAAGGVIDGQTVFKLYDTYGFPADLTAQLALENGLKIDQQGFEAEMGKQRERARAGSKFKDMEGVKGGWITLSEGPSSEFTGYDRLIEDVVIRKIRRTGQELALVTDKTPFYAESGGQAGDRGFFTDGGLTIEITDTRKEGGDIVHMGTLDGDPDLSGLSRMAASVDEQKRKDTQRNHTATHLLHAALRKVLGTHAKQSGSYVDPERFRFDYTHFASPSEEELNEVERLCNELVLMNLPVETFITTLAEAEKTGAMALFGEKYGERVRVVKIADQSLELCGGTHAKSTGEIGYVRVVSDSSIAAGTRRIEAVTGARFGIEVRRDLKLLRSLARSFKTSPDKLPEIITAQSERVRELEKEVKHLKAKNAFANIDGLISSAEEINGVRLVRERVEGYDREALQQKGEELLRRLKQGAVALMGEIDGSAAFVVAVSDDLIKSKNLHAGKIVQKLAEIVGGKGGGKPGRAQAGGKDVSKLPEAFEQTPRILKSFLP